MKLEVHHTHYHTTDPSVPAGLERILFAVGELRKLITMNDTEVQAALTEIKAASQKVYAEVSNKLTEVNATIAALQEALANAGTVSPATVALIEELRTLVASTDELIPDAAA